MDGAPFQGEPVAVGEPVEQFEQRVVRAGEGGRAKPDALVRLVLRAEDERRAAADQAVRVGSALGGQAEVGAQHGGQRGALGGAEEVEVEQQLRVGQALAQRGGGPGQQRTQRAVGGQVVGEPAQAVEGPVQRAGVGHRGGVLGDEPGPGRALAAEPEGGGAGQPRNVGRVEHGLDGGDGRALDGGLGLLGEGDEASEVPDPRLGPGGEVGALGPQRLGVGGQQGAPDVGDAGVVVSAQPCPGGTDLGGLEAVVVGHLDVAPGQEAGGRVEQQGGAGGGRYR